MYLVVTTTCERLRDGTAVHSTMTDYYQTVEDLEDAQRIYDDAVESDNTYIASLCVCVESTDYDTISEIGIPSERRKTYWKRNYERTLGFAEKLGWVDSHPDSTDPEYNADIADGIEEEALSFIRSKGYHISSPPPKDYPLPQMKSATRAS